MAEWVQLGTDEITEAQRGLGLSDERAARLVPVSTRTWIRWRQRGAVPVYLVDKVAEVLHLELERVPDRRVKISDPVDADQLEAVLERVEELRGEVREVRDLVIRALGEDSTEEQPETHQSRPGT